MKKALLIFSLLISLPVSALDEEAQSNKDLLEKKGNYQINSKYKGGDNLIFDCKGGYYACVDNDGYELCQEKRKQGLDPKSARYECAPLKKYDEKTKCIVSNYQAVDSTAAKRFCYSK